MSKVKYDDLKVTMETKETPESHLLLVHIPEGFQRHNIGAKVEFDYGRVRVFGELPPEKNVIKRFNQVYQVPETCDINNIRGKFEARIVTITMQKKEISMVPDQKPQDAPKTPIQETKPATEQDNKDHDDTPRQESPTDEEENQKGEKGKYQEEEPTPDEKEDQKDQEGLSKQDTKSTTEYEEEADDTKTPKKPEDKEESMPEIMDQKGVTQNDVQREEGMTTDEKEEKPREEETKEEIDGEKSNFEQEKQPDEETLVDDSPSLVINRKRKASSALVPYIPEPTAKRMTTILEDKQKLIYMGAAFAVVALGIYVSYKLRSSARH